MPSRKALSPSTVVDARLARDGAGGIPCTINFAIVPADGQPNFHRAAQLETGQYLVFDGDTTTATVPAGKHALTWWAAGDVGERFSFELAGDVNEKQKQSGRIPPDRITSGLVDFIATTNGDES
jgi:hypothetical protein